MVFARAGGLFADGVDDDESRCGDIRIGSCPCERIPEELTSESFAVESDVEGESGRITAGIEVGDPRPSFLGNSPRTTRCAARLKYPTTRSTGWSLMSFGEHVEIDLRSQRDGVEVTVTSMQRRGQFRDVGRRNDKNVGKILNAMETRLRS